MNKPLGVELENVRFGYPGSPEVLHGISASIEAGSTVAIIGPSGSGKTTLALLMLGLLSPTSGAVKIEGECPQRFAFQHPGMLAYLPQKTHILEATLAENIALGLEPEDIDDERLAIAIEVSQLHETVEKLPDKTREVLNQSRLSGGQSQRVGLARALYSKPSLLMLDEPTSALDADTEFAITAALQTLSATCTVVIVAHRLATIQNADKILVLENGQISGEGTFEQLKVESKLVERQAELLGMSASEI